MNFQYYQAPLMGPPHSVLLRIIYYLIIEYESPFRLSNKNEQCNDTKQKMVEDKDECRIAFADMIMYLQREFGILPWKIEYNITDPFNSREHPTGCVVVEISEQRDKRIFKDISIRWNENPSGKSNPDAYQVCKKGKN